MPTWRPSCASTEIYTYFPKAEYNQFPGCLGFTRMSTLQKSLLLMIREGEGILCVRGVLNHETRQNENQWIEEDHR